MNTPRTPNSDRLDAWLASSTPPAPPAHLRQAILRSVQAASVPPRPSLAMVLRSLWAEIGGLRIAAPVMALALALGLGTANQVWQAEDLVVAADDDLLSLALMDESYSNLLTTETQP